MNESLQAPIIWTWTVQHAHLRADVNILAALESKQGSSQQDTPPITRSQLKRLMEEGFVTQDGVVIKSSSKLRLGATVRIEFPPPRSTEIVPEEQPLSILYEDEHLVVINKPPGLTVHPSPTQMEGTLVHGLLHHIKDLSGIGGILRPGIVHRIDKNTSGALVITKTDLAHTRLAKVFSEHAIQRSYWALCFGAPSMQPSDQPIKIESLIGRHPTDRKKMSMKVDSGRRAVSYYKKLEEYSLPHKKPFASLLQVTLETGRTHQVRVHLTGSGHSILGDPVYGTPTESSPKWKAIPNSIQALIKQLPGQALHARVLGFVHPITGKTLYFEAELPEAFCLLLLSLRRYSL
jgi:23S rRNA pseudouridine1911/1915/1917 synthase